MPVSYFRLLELLSLTCFKFGEKLPHNPVEKGNFTSNLSFLSFSYVLVRELPAENQTSIFFLFVLFWGQFKKKQTNKQTKKLHKI